MPCKSRWPADGSWRDRPRTRRRSKSPLGGRHHRARLTRDEAIATSPSQPVTRAPGQPRWPQTRDLDGRRLPSRVARACRACSGWVSADVPLPIGPRAGVDDSSKIARRRRSCRPARTVWWQQASSRAERTTPPRETEQRGPEVAAGLIRRGGVRISASWAAGCECGQYVGLGSAPSEPMRTRLLPGPSALPVACAQPQPFPAVSERPPRVLAAPPLFARSYEPLLRPLAPLAQLEEMPRG